MKSLLLLLLIEQQKSVLLLTFLLLQLLRLRKAGRSEPRVNRRATDQRFLDGSEFPDVMARALWRSRYWHIITRYRLMPEQVKWLAHQLDPWLIEQGALSKVSLHR